MSRCILATFVALLLGTVPASAVAADAAPPHRELLRVALPADLPGRVTLSDVAVGEGGWVVVGWLEVAGSPEPLILHSADALTWTRASNPAGIESGLLAKVASHDAGYVASGLPGALWTSSDGLGWEVTEPEEPPGHRYFYDITTHGDTLYAVGCEALDEQACESIGVWRSDDFETLQALPLPEPMDLVPLGVAANERGVVIVGFAGRSEEGGYVEEARVAWSPDERTWVSTSLGPDARLVSVEPDAGGWLAVGTRAGKLLAVHSADGQTWTDAVTAAPDGFGIDTAPGTADVVVGYVTSEGLDHRPAAWRLGADGSLEPLALAGLAAQDRGEVSGLAVSPSGEILLLGMVHDPSERSESVLWLADAQAAAPAPP